MEMHLGNILKEIIIVLSTINYQLIYNIITIKTIDVAERTYNMHVSIFFQGDQTHGSVQTCCERKEKRVIRDEDEGRFCPH